MSLFIKDPKTNTRSASLTLVIVSFTALLIASILQIAEITNSIAALRELFGVTFAAYVGRRVKMTKDSVSIEKDNE